MALRLSSIPFDRAPTSARSGGARRRRARPAALAVTLTCLLGAACAGNGSPPQAVGTVGEPAGGEFDQNHTVHEFFETRPGIGIVAAGGAIWEEGPPCPQPDTPGAPEPVTIALVAPDVVNLDIVGLGNLVFDPPRYVAAAYLDEIEAHGGINGYCFELQSHVYGYTDPAGDFARICAELRQQQPLVMLGLGLEWVIVQCATLLAQIPTIGFYAQHPRAAFAQAGGLLWVDHGSVEFLLDNMMATAFSTGALTGDDRAALLYRAGDDTGSARVTFDAAARRIGLREATSAAVPVDYSGIPVLVLEQQFREVGGEIFDPDEASFERALVAMSPEQAGLLRHIRQHFMAVATAWQAERVTAVVASGDWSDVRNLMRAAQLLGWFPKWVINDSHYALLVLTDSPQEQGLNLVQVSSRRAPGDPTEGRDRGCLTLRNTNSSVEVFTHRYHTDAWDLMASTCDYLDIVFGAVARVDGPLTRESFVAALAETTYEASHGGLVRFADGDPYGSDSFRLLSADPNCVLNDWGCMRPLTGWRAPEGDAAPGAGGGETTDG